jgi:hypothetical protein
LSGAPAFPFPQRSIVTVEEMPVAAGDIDETSLIARIRERRPDFAAVEHVGARPVQGVSSMFRFRRSYRVVLGVLAALAVPTHLVSPSRWRRHFGLDADKERSRALALRYWPNRSHLFGRKKDQGRAQSADESA